MSLLKSLISLIFALQVITCLKAIVPVYTDKDNYAVTTFKEIHLGEINPADIGSFKFEDATKEMIIHYSYQNPKSIQCVFSDGDYSELVLTVTNGISSIQLSRGNLKLVIDANTIKILGDFGNNDGMFCIVSSSNLNLGPISFNLFHVSNHYISTMSTFLARKTESTSVLCDESEMINGGSCSKRLTITSFIKVGEKSISMRQIYLEVINKPNFVGEDTDLVSQLDYNLQITKLDNASLVYETEKNSGQQIITKQHIDGSANVEFGPIKFENGKMRVTACAELKYDLRLQFATLIFNQVVYKHDECGGKMQFTCDSLKCVDKIHDCKQP